MNLAPVIRQRFSDANNLPLVGGQLFTYQAGTTTPQTTYSNSTGTTNTNPVVMDSSGYCDVWLDPTLVYKFVLQDSLSNVLWTEDNVGSSAGTGIATWNTNTNYQMGNIVQDSSGYGLFYVSLINNNQGNALTTVSAWRVYAGNVRTVSTAQTSPTLLITDDLVRSNSTSGNLTHTLPPCSTTPIGKKISVKDVGTGGNSTQVKGSGSDLVDGNNTFAMALVAGQSVTVENNGTSWDVFGVMAPLSVTTALLAAASVTQAKRAALGQQISSSSGLVTVSASTPANVTNLTVTLTTTGRPVFVGLQSDGTIGGAGSTSQAFMGQSGAICAPTVQIARDGTAIAAYQFTFSASSAGGGIAPSCIWYIDVPTAGSHTYTLQAGNGNSLNWHLNDVVLVAFEL